MTPKLLFIFFVMSYIHQETRAADDYWMDQPYMNKEYNYHVKYGHNVTIECNDTSVTDADVMQYWIRPNLKVMLPGESEYFYTLDGDAGWFVNATTGNMHVVTVQEMQFGFYHCVLLRNNNPADIYVVKKGLNYEEAYFGSLWESYEMNTIIGLSAAGGFCIICICLMLMCKYHVVQDDDDGTTSKINDDPLEGVSSEIITSDDMMNKGNVYDNSGYETTLYAVDKTLDSTDQDFKLRQEESTVL